MSVESGSAARSRWLGLASSRRVREGLSNALKRHGLVAFFTMQIIGLTFLQKFALQIDITVFGTYISVGALQVALPIFYFGILILFAFAKPKIDITRLTLFSIFLGIVVVSLALQKSIYSQASVLLMVLCYTPFIFVVDVSGSTYRRMLQVYLNVMLVMGGIVIAQQISQLIWSWLVWPNLNTLISPQFLLPGFNYIQPIIWGSRLMKPHGIFFLEVSTVSQFIAVAFAIEIIYFRRIWRLVFYTLVLLATFAGTGPLLLVLCAPVLLVKLSPRTILMVIVLFAVGCFAADRISWYQQVQGRFTEYEKQGTSAHARFVDPLTSLAETIGKPDRFLTGIGAGNTAKDDGTVSWATTKVAVEYGVLSLIGFSAFIGYVLFKDAPSQRMAFMLVVFFNFMGGGIVIPIYPVMIFIMGGLFRIEKAASDKGREHRGRDSSTRRIATVQGLDAPATAVSTARQT
jgi:hypothetical protein